MKKPLLILLLILCAGLLLPACLCETARTRVTEGAVREYDEAGQLIKITYTDSEGNPAPTAGGYTVLVRQYDESGRVCAFYFYDAEGNPAATPRGAYGQRIIYGADGNKTGYRLLNADGSDMFILVQFLDERPFLCAAALGALMLMGLLLPKRLCAGLLSAYALFILIVTLCANRGGGGELELNLIESLSHVLQSGVSARHFAENALIFMLMGVLCFRLCPKLWVIAACALFSALIEAAQYIFALGCCELDDVASNIAGALAGWGIAKVCERFFRRKAS